MANQTLAKFVNERAILTLLRAKGALSRAEIARHLGLTQATIGRLTSEMIRRGLLHDLAAAPDALREPGRPGIALQVNPVGGYFLGVEIGVLVLRLVLLDLRTNVAEAVELPWSEAPDPKVVVSAIAREIRRLQDMPPYRGRIKGMGVTVPGLVTTEGFVVNLPILGWRSADLRAALSQVTDLPVTIENNAHAAAFGAVYSQPGLVAPFTLFVKLGTGCGGAAIVGGRLLRGADGTGLEIGHLRIAPDGPPCHCGQRGCLETFVNLAALERLWGAPCSPAQVAAAHDAGDTAALTATAAIVGHLATGLVSLINILNPAQVVLGGAMLPILSRALPLLRTQIAARIIPGTRMPDLLSSPLGPFECAIGAACIAHHIAFDIQNVDIGAVF